MFLTPLSAAAARIFQFVVALALTATVSAQGLPAVPPIEVSRVTMNGCTLFWGDVPPDVDSIRLEANWSGKLKGPFQPLSELPASAKGQHFTQFSRGSKIAFRLGLVRDGAVQFGPAVRAVTRKKPSPLPWPVSVTEREAFHDRVDLIWLDRSEKEAGFKVFRRADGVETRPAEFLLPANSTSFRDTGMVPGRTYFYSVAAVDKKGVGDPTFEIEVQVPLPGDLPNKSIFFLSTQANGPGSVMLHWTTRLGGNIAGYSIQRLHSTSGAWIEVGRAARFANSVTDGRLGALPGMSYRAVPFNDAGMVEDFGGPYFAQKTPFAYGHHLWQEPVLKNGVIHLLDPAGRKIHRFDTQTANWLPPVELNLLHPAYCFDVGNESMFAMSADSLYRIDAATGDGVFLASSLFYGHLIAEGDYVFHLSGGTFLGVEPAPDIGVAYSVPRNASNINEPRIARLPGGKLLLCGNDAGTGGVTPAVETVELNWLEANYASRFPLAAATKSVFPVGGGRLLMGDTGFLTVGGDTKSPPIAVVGSGTVLALAPLPDDCVAVLRAGAISVYDRWWNLLQTIPVAADVIAVRESAGRLWSISADATESSGWRVAAHDYAAATEDAAFWTSPFAPEALESTLDAGQVLVHRASATWRRREPGAPAFGPPQDSDGGIIDWKFDRAGDALAVLWGGGGLTRQAFSGDPAGTWQGGVRKDAAFMVEVGGTLEFSNGQTIAWNGLAAGPGGYWLFRPNFTAWDSVKKYCYFQWFTDLIISNRDGTSGYGPSLSDLNEETFSDFLRIAPERDFALFGGGLMCKYPSFVNYRQLPLDARDAEWTAGGLVAIGPDASSHPKLGSFSRDGETLAAVTLPGAGLQVTRDGADGWLVLCTLPGGGWQILKTDAAFTTFAKLAGTSAPLPVADPTFPDATMRFPEWYEEQVNIGDPDHDGLSAIQEYMLGETPEYKNLRPVMIYRPDGKLGFYIRRRSDAELDPFRLAIEYSPDLQTWTEQIPASFTVTGYTFSNVETVIISPKPGSPPAGYFRVRYIGPTFDNE